MGMVDDGHGLARGRSDFPTLTEEVDLVVGLAAATKMQGEMQVEEAGFRGRTQGVAGFVLGLVPGLIGGEASGPANSAVLALNLAVEDDLGRVVMDDSLEGQQGEQALLEGAEATFDFPLGVGRALQPVPTIRSNM